MKVVAFLCLMVSGCLAETTVEKLVNDGRFTTLVNLVTQANLVDTLNGGNFTIFAPTDAAIARISADVLAQIQANDFVLKQELLFHVVRGFVMSSAVTNELVVDTVSSEKPRLNVYVHNGVQTVTIEGCRITSFDMMASNGVIHVLDKMMKLPLGDIVRQVYQDPNLTTVLGLIQQAGLESALKGQALTLFAPTNDAFAKLDVATQVAVQSDATLLQNVLKYHVVASTQYSAGLYDNEVVPTLLTGKEIKVHVNSNSVKINDALVTIADLGATNGVVHVINTVLIPPAGGSSIVG